MATPFEQWFSSDWIKALHDVPDDPEALSNGRLCDASWDRRAGYLLWVQIGRPRAAWVEQAAPAYEKVEDLLADDRSDLQRWADIIVKPEADDLDDLLG